jgi:ribosomal protein S14
VSTTVPQPSAPPPATTKDAPRCDRCGARAVAVTHHRAADLGWCRHHLREHAASLEAAGVDIALLRDAA